MALGVSTSPETSLGVGGGLGTAPITSLASLKDTFGKMKESLGAMVGIQTKEAKRQEFVDKKLLEQQDFEIKMMNEKFADSGAAGAPMPDSNDDLAGVDTDDKTYGNFVEKAETVSGNILNTIKEAFDNVSLNISKGDLSCIVPTVSLPAVIGITAVP